MGDFLRDVWTAARDRWQSKTGLVGVIGVVCASLVLTFAGIDLANVSRFEWAIVAAFALGIALAWRQTAYPRNPRRKVGFGVAIEYEDDADAARLRSDFVLTLRDMLGASPLRHQFHFVEFPQRVAKDLSNEERARFVAQRSNIHFLLYGRGRLRTRPEGPAYVIDLKALVRHAAVDALVSQRLREDFSASMPNRLIVCSGPDILACEFAAKHVDAVARYIIGTAAALSNDFPYAEELLLDAEARLRRYQQQAEGLPLSVLLNKVRTRLREFYQEWLARLMRRYTFKRDVDALRAAEPIIGKLLNYDPQNYEGHLCLAICAFVLRRDIEAAKKEIEACRRADDGAWRYSEAFLHAYKGDLDAAYYSYRSAFAAPLRDPTVVTQCEEFIQGVLDAEPDRKWLYYCLGLLNHRVKRDLEAARCDFQSFVAGVDAARFRKHIPIANKWIEEISALLGATPAPLSERRDPLLT